MTTRRFLPLVLGAALAFVGRELATYMSYRAKLALGLVSLVFSLVMFSFVGKVVAVAGSGFVERYGMDYTSFAVVGIFVHSLASSGLHSFRSAVRREQVQGTLEHMLATRLPPPVLVTLAGLGELCITLVGGAALMLVAAAIVGIDVPHSPEAVAGVLFYIGVMCGLGLASAGVVMVVKEGEPISWAVGGIAGLLGGVYFPVDMLPRWLQSAGHALPTSRALALARYGTAGGQRMMSGADAAPAGSLTSLAWTAAASVVVGFIVLEWGCRRARREATLGQY
jgi:ABC-2 type transport system permease protein